MMNKHLRTILYRMMIGVMAVIFISPFYICLLYAFTPMREIVPGNLVPPSHLYLDNFRSVIFDNPMFRTGLLNSIITTVPTVVLVIIICSMASYVLARNDKKKTYSLLYYVFIIGLFLPFQCLLLPLYKNMRAVGLMNNLWGFILAKTGFDISYTILVMTSFVKTVPRDMDDAARIDGGNKLVTFWMVIFPLMKPVVVTVAVLNAVFVWNDFSISLILLQKTPVRILTLAQFYYFGENTVALNLAFAFFTLSMLPMLIIYLVTQKYIVRGVMAGAVKG